jgi:hypothetical protein
MDINVKRYGAEVIIEAWGQDYRNNNGFSTLSLWMKPELALRVGHALIEEASKSPRIMDASDIGLAA